MRLAPERRQFLAIHGLQALVFRRSAPSHVTYLVGLVFDGTLTKNVPTSSIGDLVDTFNFLENGTVIPGAQYSGMVATLAPGSQQSSPVVVFFGNVNHFGWIAANSKRHWGLGLSNGDWHHY